MCLYKIIVTKLTLLPLVLAKHKLSFLQNHCYKAQYVGLASVWETQHICQVLDIIFFEKLWSRQKTLHFWGGEDSCRTKQVILIWGRYDIQSSIMEFAHLLKTILYILLKKKKKEEDYLVHQIKTNLEVTYMY